MSVFDVESLFEKFVRHDLATIRPVFVHELDETRIAIASDLERTESRNVWILLHHLPEPQNVSSVEDRIVVDRQNVFRLPFADDSLHQSLETLSPEDSGRLRERHPEMSDRVEDMSESVGPRDARKRHDRVNVERKRRIWSRSLLHRDGDPTSILFPVERAFSSSDDLESRHVEDFRDLPSIEDRLSHSARTAKHRLRISASVRVDLDDLVEVADRETECSSVAEVSVPLAKRLECLKVRNAIERIRRVDFIERLRFAMRERVLDLEEANDVFLSLVHSVSAPARIILKEKSARPFGPALRR